MIEKVKKRRYIEISLMNVFLCALVIFIHITANPLVNLDTSSWQYALIFVLWRISKFAAHGFFFLSGLRTFINNKKINYSKFYISRLKNIVLPYILWVIIYYIYFFLRDYYSFSLYDLFRYIISGELVAHLYFIIVIVQFYILLPLWKICISKISPVIGLIFSLVITLIFASFFPNIIDLFKPNYYFNYTDRIFISYLFFWIAGCYAGANYKKFIHILKTNKIAITVMFIFMAIISCYFSYIHTTGKAYVYFVEFINICYMIVAILFMYMLVIYCSKYLKKIKLLKIIDNVSYSIYLSHCLFIFSFLKIIDMLGIKSIGLNYILLIISVYSSIIIFAIIWYKLKNKMLNNNKKLVDNN